MVNGSIADSAVTVQSGASLGGNGVVGGLTVANGGIVEPGNSVGTLMVDGNLTLAPGSILVYELGSPGSPGAPGTSDRIDVTGDLALNGTLHLSQSDDAGDGAAGLGYYRVMTYGGELTSNELIIGAVPHADASLYLIQAGGGNVDLFVPAAGTPGDDTLQHWQGGDGIWNASDATWLNAGDGAPDGDIPAAWAGNHAIFQNQPGGFDGGAVAVEGNQSFEGLQFVDEGYRLQGNGSLETVAGGSEIRVLADSAEIATEITGAGGIMKTQAGTLVLSGANSYTGGTVIEAGTIKAGAAGAIQGDYVIGAEGTLDMGAQSATLTALAGEGGILFGPSGAPTLTIDQPGATVFSGSFGLGNIFGTSQITLNKRGAGTLALTGDSVLNFSPGSFGLFSLDVSRGTLAIEDGGALRYGGATDIGGNEGALRVSGAGTRWHSGMLSLGNGGPGSLVLRDGAEAWTRTFARIGLDAEGTASLSNGATWRQDGSLTVGQGSSTGRLVIESGSKVTTGGTATLGKDADATGEVVVRDAHWATNQNILLGDNGKANLEIRDGGVVEVGEGYSRENGAIGYGPNAEGSVLVDGASSRWSLATLAVGYQGLGILELSNGGTVESRSVFVGDSSTTGDGTAIVRGDDTVWRTWDLTIGRNGRGRVILAEGGTLDTGLSGIVLAEADGSEGTLQIGEGGRAGNLLMSGSAVTFGAGDGTLLFNHTEDGYLFNPRLSSASDGKGTIIHQSGVTRLGADNSGFAGTTRVAGGTMLIENALGGSVTVADGAVLGGTGTAGSGAGSVVTIEDGGVLAPGDGAVATFTVDGDLALSSGAILDYRLGAPGTAGNPAAGRGDRVAVAGDLMLDGTLNLSRSGIPSDGDADLGYYRLMTYGGNLADNGLDIGQVPYADAGLYEIRADSGHVDLFVPASSAPGDDTLQHWQGGDGTWDAGAAQWLNQGGDTAVAWAGNHAVFKNQPGDFEGGIVAVEGVNGFKGLQFVDEGYRLQGTGTLEAHADGAEIRVLAERAEIAAEITGAGGVAKTEAGMLVLSGVNTYEGGTIISDGVLSVSSDTNLGDAQGTLVLDGGVLQITGSTFSNTERDITLGTRGGGFDITDASNDFRIGHSLAGSGDLVKRGEGTLTLSGANAYGNTRVEQGRLQGAAESISGDIANAGTVAFIQNNDARFAGDISGLGGADGKMVKEGVGLLHLEGRSTLDWTVAGGGLATEASRFGGNVRLDGIATGLTFTDTNDAVYGGTISGTGQFAFDGAGTLRLSGDSSGFAGATEVRGGTLLVGADGGGVLGGSLDVLSGATLGGSGTVGAGAGSTLTLASGGTLAPGNSIGTLTVDGDLTFEAGSRFEVEVNPQGSASDLVAVTGNATLNGGSVAHIGAAGEYALRSTYTILTAGGTLSGTFDEVTSDFAFLAPDLLYDYGAGAVELELSRNDRDFASAAQTRNQIATADGIESIGLDAAHPVYDAIVQLPDDSDLIRASFDALSGEIHASTRTALIEDSRFIRNAANDRVRAAFATPGASSAAVQAYGPGQVPTQVSASHQGPVVWSQAFGAWGSTDSDGNAASLDRNTGGLLVGADRPIGDWRVGVLAGYSHSDVKARDRASSGRSDNYHLGLYGGTQWDALGLRAGLAYTWHDIDAKRSVAVPGLSGNPRAGYHAGTLQAFGELGYGIDAGAIRLEPFANLAHVRLHTDGYRESGSEAALWGSSDNTDVTFTTLGLRAEHGLSIGAAEATLRGTVGWRHAFGDTTPTARHRFSAGEAFTVAGVPIAKDSAVLEAGVDVKLTSRATFGLSYAGQLSGSTRDHGVQANLAVTF